MRQPPTVEEATTLALAIYARPGGSAGCCLGKAGGDERLALCWYTGRKACS